MATRYLEEDVKNIVFLGINSYESNGYANFSVKNGFLTLGVGTDKIQYYLKELVKDGKIKNETINGYFSKYKIFNPIECPDYIFNRNLTIGQKIFIEHARKVLNSYEVISTAELTRLLGRTDRSQVSKSISNIKKAIGISIFNILQNMNSFKMTVTGEYKADIKENELGIQVDTNIKKEEYCCQYCGDTNLSHFDNSHITCRKCGYERTKLKDPETFLMYKSRKGYMDRHNIEDFALTKEIIKKQLENQKYLDYYTGLEFNNIEDMSIDRIDSSLGYIENNIVITHKDINIMKNSFSIEYFKELIINIYNNKNNF